MVKRILFALLLFVALPAFAAVETTTINFTVVLPSGATATGGTVMATLSTSGETPNGASTSVVAARTSATIASNGAVALVLVPNDAITPEGTYYIFHYDVRTPTLASWKESRTVATTPDPALISDTTLLSTVPGVASPVSRIQDEATSLTRRSKLNFTGGGVACSDNPTDGSTDCVVNGTAAVRFADSFSGANAGAKIAAAIADLPSTGGTVDARGLEGSQTISSALAVGTATRKVRLVLGSGTTFNVTVTGGVDAITIASGSSIIGEGHGAGPLIQLDATANVRSIIAPAATDGTQEYFYLSGVALKGNTSATATSILYISNVYVNSFVRDVVVYGFNTIGVYVYSDDSSGGTGPIIFDNIWSNGGGNAGARPVVIKSSTASLYGITFIGGALENPGTGQIICEIDGGAQNGAVRNVAMYNTHIENASAGTATIGVKVTDAHNVLLDGIQGIFTPDDTDSSFVSINETSSGYTRGVIARAVKFNTATQTAKTLVNNITSESYAGTPNLHSYTYGGASLPVRVAGSDFVLTDSTGAERINLTNAIGGVLGIFRNRSDAQSAVVIDSGLTSTQGAGWQFRDRGTLKWRLEKNSSNTMVLRDETNSLNRMTLAQGGATAIHSAGTSAVQVNSVNSSGTGGLEVYDGAVSSAKVSYLSADGSFAIKDGITAPSTASGYAVIYVDTSDGDLKVKFGDGTVKTLVVDTP